MFWKHKQVFYWETCPLKLLQWLKFVAVLQNIYISILFFTVADLCSIFKKKYLFHASQWLEKAPNVEKPLSESVINWKGLCHCCVLVVLLMKTLHKQRNFTLLSVSLWRDWVCSSLHRAANRIKPCKVGAVSPVLAFDPNSALFKRPSLTERELCQFNGALCHVRQAKRCSACLCSAVLESGLWAISATNTLRVRLGWP